ncbi:MAG: tRNA (adenosine(37)-N6)-threonylcarbamoyltransferase complex dimerization subunit type 1 TsaB [Geoalkalibacter sp.]|jgi:tRNA threonylcarbamoyladenosine biosynthesis protein TsaB|uniref:tRNA (adenosine(37)-N6)-threonylcarbamoyltransferase complex dimerization subunit type 1 TsaB n=1 Tax=Geoalkalibacter sp. TaxID=3041440 RepID=UPI002A94BD50|nr:tRNA (adenosine(37)-N6)-threonylcarbamoyltransferase complex dimerization subunit type 1 TsaB [Thermodesulfobacteriota bacterium]
MKTILAIDTVTSAGSAAVCRGTKLLSESYFNTGARHAERIMAAIDRALIDADVALEEIDLFAVTRGPGSFTGVRVGMAAAKGLALALNKPLVGISSLQALAMNAAGCTDQVCAMLDARKKEVYAGLYHVRQGHFCACCPEQVASPAAVVEQISEPTLFVGEGAMVYRELIESALGTQARFVEGSLNWPRASMAALLAAADGQMFEPCDARLVKPVYLRASEAEIAWQKRRSEEALQG